MRPLISSSWSFCCCFFLYFLVNSTNCWQDVTLCYFLPDHILVHGSNMNIDPHSALSCTAPVVFNVLTAANFVSQQFSFCPFQMVSFA